MGHRFKKSLMQIKKPTTLQIKIISIFIIFILFIYLVLKDDSSNCYCEKIWKDGKTLQEIDDNMHLKLHPTAKKIFFHETSCIKDGIIRLNARQACAIESAARANPDYDIYVLFASPVGYRNKARSPIIRALQTYSNVHFNYVNLSKYSENTPLEEWLKSKKLYTSQYLEYHTNDVLKYLSLWKYGGTYLDLDTVLLKPLDTLKRYNYVGAQTDSLVGTGIVHLDGPTGHKIASLLVNELLINFNGKIRDVNGPWAFMKVLLNICGTGDVEKMVMENPCENFRVFPTQLCYNINVYDHKKFFMEEFVDEVFVSINNSLMIHTWNPESAEIPLKKDENAPYIRIAQEYCPKTLEACDEF